MIDFDTIFRSIINFKDVEGNPTISQKDLIKNFRVLQNNVPDPPEEKGYHELYQFIWDYLTTDGGSSPELPSYEYVRNHFENTEGNEAALAVLSKIALQQPYVGQDYRQTIKRFKEEQAVIQLERILSNTNKIATTGMVEGYGKNKRKLHGIMDSISYFAKETKDLQRNVTGVKLESQVVSTEDANEVMEEYEKVKMDPTEILGIYTGIQKIDEHFGGLKNHELMIVGAYTGHCKTTFSLNMAYRALYGGWNTAFVSLEMSFEEIRRMIYTLHSCNPKFKIEYPEYAPFVGNLKYNDVVYGNLSSDEHKFFRIVCDDMRNNEDYGKFYIWQPEKTVTTVEDIDFKFRQIQHEFQSDDRNLEFGVVDYVSLLGVDRGSRTSDHNQNLNNIIKQLKRTCLTFNNGKGVRMLSPFQMNREGFKEAKANDGVYFSTALSNAHEAERSADVIMSLWLGEEQRRNGTLKICNLKDRRNKLFPPLEACINLESKFIYDFAGQTSDPAEFFSM